MDRRSRGSRGFSLVELVAALAVTGVVATGLMLWMSRPLQAVQDSQARAAALDQAQRVSARLQRDLGEALPNSVRIGCGGACLELIPVVAHGDYRTAAPGDILQFGAADDRFDVLKPLGVTPQPGMQVVINNENALPAGPASAYSADGNNNRATVVAGATPGRLRISSKQFPAPSPTQRFYLVTTPVSYLCAPLAAGGSLRRHAGYAIQAAQPGDTTVGDLLASGVTGCTFSLDVSGLVTLRLRLSGEAGDPVAFVSQVGARYQP